MKNWSAVPPGIEGLSRGQKFRKHGIRASRTAEVILDDVRVPGRCLVGGKEKLARSHGQHQVGNCNIEVKVCAIPQFV